MIDKYAASEVKTLIRIHTANINAWAGASAAEPTTPPNLKEALLATCARLYELIEELPIDPKEVS